MKLNEKLSIYMGTHPNKKKAETRIEAGLRPDQWIKVRLSEAGVSPGRTLDLGSYHAIIACVAAGAGVSIVPVEVLDQAVMASAVQRHPLPVRLRVNRTHLVWSGEASASLRALLHLLPKPRRTTRGRA